MLNRSALFLIILTIGVPWSSAAEYHTDPLCWHGIARDEVLTGAAATETLKLAAGTLSIDHAPGKLPEPYTPNHEKTYAFYQKNEPLLDRWSGATRVQLQVFVERPYLLRLTFGEIFNLLKLNWVSSNLLYFREVISRREAVDYIFDVESESVVFRQAIAFPANIEQQATESCKTPEMAALAVCHPKCFSLK